MSDLAIIVPMKDPMASKTRLADTLQDAERARLAKLLFRRTLSKLASLRTRLPFGLGVVTASSQAAWLAELYGAEVIREAPVTDLNAAISQAAHWATEQGYGRLCVLPSDLAAPETRDLERLISERSEMVTICPSTDLGTNALMVPLPNRFAFAYGRNSAEAHARAAEEAGLSAKVWDLESLRLDIDTGECLAQAKRQVPELTGFGA